MSQIHNNSIVLMGCKHCGKSTQGRIIAQKLGCKFFDTDDVIKRFSGIDVRDYYKQNGASVFMQLEEKVCKKIIDKNKGQQIVISTGGGVCENPPALSILRECETFVFLRLDIKYSVERIMRNVVQIAPYQFKNVPAYVLEKEPETIKDVSDILFQKYEQRYNLYQVIADEVVDIINAPIEENSKLIFEALGIN
ncbi:shikimate kinase [Treponema sp. Marseille-Q3903]|uniref:shikimate kinase n=1 Tax=Treponema sp. Marseille-Q3903 TaxID=2766703 RepID=UPI001652529A|nr:shikimate kinase [Treponema sp. Marseille-Q3903]